MKSWKAAALLALAVAPALALAACGGEVQPPAVRNLDRPTAVSFTCYGDLRVDGNVVTTAQPPSACAPRPNGAAPPGQDGLTPPVMHGFVLQSGRGTVAVIDARLSAVLDSDPLTPGRNAIPVGTLPVGIAMDPSGCHAITANAGTCDLTVLNTNAAIDRNIPNTVTRVRVFDGGGKEVLAKPGAIASVPDETPRAPGNACPADPSSPSYSDPERLVYVAYPACNLVAAVDITTDQQGLRGVVRGAVSFAGGTPTVVSDLATLNCTAQCGTAAPGVGTTAPRPVALNIISTPQGALQLFIGAENNPNVAVVSLDRTTFLPQGAMIGNIALQVRPGQTVGVTSLKATPQVAMGGSGGLPGSSVFRFLYAITTDRTIRVANVATLRECDTQVDARELIGLRNPTLYACIPVGDNIGTPPHVPRRRSGARSPGIQLPNDVVPLDISFANVAAQGQNLMPAPTLMAGFFAFVPASDGNVYVVNVDDDVYEDDEIEGDPLAVFLPLALAHQLRDNVRDRVQVAQNCGLPDADPTRLGPRLASRPDVSRNAGVVSDSLLYLLPHPQGAFCSLAAGGVSSGPVEETHFAAPAPVREAAFPDIRSNSTESWFFRWEGTLSLDSATAAVNGPVVRSGSLSRDGARLVASDGARRFCATGIERGDIFDMLGCDPARADQDCGVDETCFVHPATPATVNRGICIRKGTNDQLAEVCRPFLVTFRRYTVNDAFSDRLVLEERKRVLRTTPLDGCTSVEQCQQLYELEKRLPNGEHPNRQGPMVPNGSFACEPDPSRQSDGSPGVARCIMTCQSATDCEVGFGCAGGRCVEGVMPEPACLDAVQRYQLRVGDAFAVVGSRSGFLHNREAAGDGRCITSATPDPLMVGRLPLRPRQAGALATCTGTPPNQTPNPCLEAVTHVENFIPHVVAGDGTCTPQSEMRRDRSTRAVLFRNPAMTFHMADVETSGDRTCRADLMGRELASGVVAPLFSPVYTDYTVRLDITGGFSPMVIASDANAISAFPVNATEAPDGRIWVLDQGDRNASTRGTVFTFDPTAASSAFSLIRIF